MPFGISKYFSFFQLEFQRLHEFKFDFFFFWVESLFRMWIVMLFWLAIFHHASGEYLAQLDKVTFLSLMLVTRLVALPMQNGDQVSSYFETPVVSGTMAAIICRPVHPIWMNLMRVLVDKLRLGVFSFVLLFLCHLFVKQFFSVDILAHFGDNALPFVISLILAYLIHYFLYTILGLFSFWIGHVWSLLYIVGVLNTFLAGYLFPLEIEPHINLISQFLPFRYCGYSSAAIFMGRVGVEELAKQSAMLCLCMGLAFSFYRLSLKKFEAAGG